MLHVAPIDNKQFEIAWMILRGRGSFQGRIGPNDYKTCARIQAAVCKHFAFKRENLISLRRSPRLVNARHIAIFLCHTNTVLSSISIGNEFGGMDHTTVLYAIKRIERLKGSDRSIATAIRKLNKEVGAKA